MVGIEKDVFNYAQIAGVGGEGHAAREFAQVIATQLCKMQDIGTGKDVPHR